MQKEELKFLKICRGGFQILKGGESNEAFGSENMIINQIDAYVTLNQEDDNEQE